MFGLQPAESFSIGSLTIYWYGIFITLGILAGYLLAIYHAKIKKIKTDHIENLILLLIPLAIISARLYHVTIEWDYYQNEISQIPNIRAGGIAIHGAILGGLIAIWLYSKFKKISFLQLTDLVVPSLAIGQAIGRWGNFFNQELYGQPTDLPWAITIEAHNRMAPHLQEATYHPTFFYESILNLLNCLLLIFLTRRWKLPPGIITAFYLINYGIIRFLMEFIRIDENNILGPLKLAHLTSLLLITAGISYIIYLYRQKKLTFPLQPNFINDKKNKSPKKHSKNSKQS